MKQGDLVLIKIQGKNVIGYIQYFVQDQVSVNVDHSFKVKRGVYLVSKNQVKLVNYCNESKAWSIVC